MPTVLFLGFLSVIWLSMVLTTFYIALFSALEQIHCALVAYDSKRTFYSVDYPPK